LLALAAGTFNTYERINQPLAFAGHAGHGLNSCLRTEIMAGARPIRLGHPTATKPPCTRTTFRVFAVAIRSFLLFFVYERLFAARGF
jgi:hypothetical protein